MFDEIDKYISMLSGSKIYTDLVFEEKEKVIFSATELLKDHFPQAGTNIRAIALQVLYTLEGDDEEYAKLKRHGVKSYSVKGVSVSFEGSGVSPDVILLLGRKKGAYTGTLI